MYISLYPIVRRIEVKEGVRSIVPGQDVIVGQIFNVDPREPPVNLDNDLLEVEEVQFRPSQCPISKIGRGYKGGIGLLQKIEPFDGAVDVGEAVVVVALHQLEDAAGDEEGLELAEELFGVVLDHSVEVDDVVVQVV